MPPTRVVAAGSGAGGWLVDVPGADFSWPIFVAAAGGALVWLAVWFGLPEADVPRPAAVSVQPAALLLIGALIGLAAGGYRQRRSNGVGRTHRTPWHMTEGGHDNGTWQ